MSTLKKILALTLALAMVLSLNVFATFKDQDLIDEDCASACTLMDDLGVLKGDKGNMKPEDPITRAEVATMIYRVMNKGKDDSSNYKGMKLFTDVKEGKWYEGYINYCATMGLVSGVGNNKFNPNGLVKGTEVLKMLLGCLGYKGEGAKFTGSGWANRVIAQADEIGLIDEYAPALTANAPRQWVAYLFEKAMGCQMVSWNKLTEEFIPKTADGRPSVQNTLGYNKFGLNTFVGKVTAINLDEAADKPAVKFVVTNSDGVDKEFTKFALDTALYGQKVTVNYKTLDKVYGVSADGKALVETVNVVDLKGTDKDGVYKLTADTELKAADGVWTAVKPVMDATTTNKYNGKLLARTVTLVASAGDKWDSYYFTECEYGDYKVDAKTGDVTFDRPDPAATDPTVKKDDIAKTFKAVGELANKDYVKVTYLNFGKLPTVEKLEKQTLKLTKVVGSDAEVKLTLGGTAYQVATGANLGANAFDSLVDHDVYVDCGLIVKADKTTEAAATALSENRALVLAAKAGSPDAFSASENMVKVLLLNGETKEFAYKNLDGAAYMTFAQVQATGVDNETTTDDDDEFVVEYKLSDDGKITFKTAVTLPEKHSVASVTTDTGVVEVKNNYFKSTNAVRFDKDAKFFTKTAKSGKPVYAVMTFADFTGDFTVTAFKNYVTYNADKAIPMFVGGFMVFNYNAVTTDAVYAIAADASYKTLVDDETKDVIDVTLKDGTTTMLTLGSSAAKGVYTYTVTDGEAALTAVTFADGTQLEYVAGNEIKLNGVTELKTVADDAVVIIKTADGAAFKTLADVEVKTGYTTTVLYKTNDKGNITVLLVNFAKNS